MVKFPLLTRERTSSSRPSSCLATFPTSQSSSLRLLLRPSTRVSCLGVHEHSLGGPGRFLTGLAAYELNELVINLVKYKQKTLLENPEALAIDTVHALAFHRGLGENITPTTAAPYEQYLTAEAVAEFAKGAYAKPNVAVVASGPNSTELSKWVNEFFGQLPSSVPSNQFQPRSTAPSKYFGGEQRVPGKNGNAVVIAFPGSSAYGTAGYKAEAAVLTALLGGESTIKWAPGFSLLGKATAGFSQAKVSTKNFSYSDAGLLTISVTGKADQVASASKNVVDTIKKVAAGEVASEDIKKAAALAKFRAFEAGQNLETGLEITGSGLIHGNKAYQLGEVAEAIDKVTEQQVKDVRAPTLLLFLISDQYAN